MAESHLSVTLKEDRSFPPSEEFTRNARFKPEDIDRQRQEGKSDPEGYWADAALELNWFRRWDKVLEWKAPQAKWFLGGKLNASYNCLDRHLKTQPHKVALIWEGEPGEVATWTYSELHYQVERFTAALRKLGLKS